MRRDMDLVRKILLTLEDAPTGNAPHPLRVDGYEQKTIGYHVLIMTEADLLKGQTVTALGDDTPRAIATRLTWAGHEFAAAARSETVWTNAKAAVGKVGAATLPIWLKLLSEAVLKHVGAG